MITSVIFDFDGLIVDTESAWYSAYKKAMKEYEVFLPLFEFVKCVGADSTLLDNFIKKNLGMDFDVEIIKNKAKEFHQKEMNNFTLREGVKAYLKEAKTLGLHIALASSSRKEWVLYFLEKFGLTHYFDAIVTREDVIKIKPAPDLYLKAVEKLNINPNEAVAFEDSLNGNLSAVAAGVQCVIVSNPVTEGLPFENYSLRLESMKEKNLSEVISYINKR